MCSDLQPNFRSKVRVMYDLFEIWFYAIAQIWLRIFTKKKKPSTVTSVQVVSSFNVPPTSSFDQVHFRPPCKTIVQTLYFLDLPLSVIYYAHRVVDKGYAMILNFIIFLSLRQSKASKMHFNVTSTTFFRKQALNRR